MEEEKAPPKLIVDYTKESTPNMEKTYEAEDAKILREGSHGTASETKNAKNESEQDNMAKTSLKERLSDVMWHIRNNIAPDAKGAILLGTSGGIFGAGIVAAGVAIFALPLSGIIVGAAAGVAIGASIGGYWRR